MVLLGLLMGLIGMVIGAVSVICLSDIESWKREAMTYREAMCDLASREGFLEDTNAILNKQVTIAEERVRDVQDRSRVISSEALRAQLAFADLDEALTAIRGQVDGIMKFELTYDEPESDEEDDDEVPF